MHSHKPHHIHTHEQESGNHTHKSHEHSLKNELICHIPYAAFSLALGFIVLSVLHFVGMQCTNKALIARGYHILFHSFHYLHILYAVMGTFVTFSRFSRSMLVGIPLSLISPMIFCTLSDIALPVLAGRILGVPMNIHICFVSELHNIIPLMLIGLVTGLAVRAHHETSLGFFSLSSHFIHISISSLASLFYMVSYGFDAWYNVMGLLYVFLAVAVVIPCTLSDVVVPMYFARWGRKKNEKHTS